MSFTSKNPRAQYISNSKKSLQNQTLGTKKYTEKAHMIAKIDFYFPFLVFFYGLVMMIVLEVPYLLALAKKEMPVQYAQFEKHRNIAVLSFYVGGLWSLQNIWL